MRSQDCIEDCNWRDAEKKKQAEREKPSELLPDEIMMHIQGKSGSAKFTKSHIVTLLVHVFEQTDPTSTMINNDLMDDLRSMEENHQDFLMEAAENFADVKIICFFFQNSADKLYNQIIFE